MNITRYILMGKRTKSARKAAKKSSSSASVRRRRPLSSSKRERGGIPIPQLPNWGNFTIPLSECDGSNSLPRARFWCRFQHRRPKESDKTMMATASLFSSKLSPRCITHATLLIKYNNTRRNRDSARPRVKATKSGPNRKRMRSPPG